VYIVVNTITELNAPKSCHGKSLARLARECFANHQTLTIDFEGIKTIPESFFHELFLPLVAEFGADYLKTRLMVANMTSHIDDLMKAAFGNLDAYFEKRTNIHDENYDEDIYSMNLAWLTKSREITRENPILAGLILGINNEEMLDALSQLSFDDIQYLAQTNWLCFSPRFSTHFIQSMESHQRQPVEIMLGFSGSSS